MTASKIIKRGKLAKQSGCNLETIRYYEKIGLLTPPERTASGHRLYSPGELKSLFSLVDSHDYSCGEVQDLTSNHLASVRSKIADLRRLEQTLAEVSARCEGGNVPECPIIDTRFGRGPAARP